MNGYTMLADGYRKLMNDGRIDKESAEKHIRIYDFLATCDEEDLCIMVDSSAFNDLIVSFVKLAIDDSGIDDKSRYNVISQLRCMFDDVSAKDVFRIAEETAAARKKPARSR